MRRFPRSGIFGTTSPAHTQLGQVYPQAFYSINYAPLPNISRSRSKFKLINSLFFTLHQTKNKKYVTDIWQGWVLIVWQDSLKDHVRGEGPESVNSGGNGWAGHKFNSLRRDIHVVSMNHEHQQNNCSLVSASGYVAE